MMSTNQKQVDSVNEHLRSETQVVQAPANLKKEKFGWLEVEHGETDKGDYVWHFSDYHHQRKFPKDQKKILEIIVTYLDKVIPDNITKDVFPTPESWDKSVITVRANGIAKKWNFDEEAMTKPLKKIGELISEEIEKHVTRRSLL